MKSLWLSIFSYLRKTKTKRKCYPHLLCILCSRYFFTLVVIPPPATPSNSKRKPIKNGFYSKIWPFPHLPLFQAVLASVSHFLPLNTSRSVIPFLVFLRYCTTTFLLVATITNIRCSVQTTAFFFYKILADLITFHTWWAFRVTNKKLITCIGFTASKAFGTKVVWIVKYPFGMNVIHSM